MPTDSTPELPWPVPDRRARYFVAEFADMHAIVRSLEVPAHIPANTARAFVTARELIRFSFYHYEFAAVAVSTSIIAIEAALRERYGGNSLSGMISSALADGTITVDQADHLQTGRQIRNRYAHGKTQHPSLPIPYAAELVKTSLDVIVLLVPQGDCAEAAAPMTIEESP